MAATFDCANLALPDYCSLSVRKHLGATSGCLSLLSRCPLLSGRAADAPMPAGALRLHVAEGGHQVVARAAASARDDPARDDSRGVS
jgi:hypothetical protein